MTGLKYRPEIDGLRALAIIPVILFHAGVSSFDGGYVGAKGAVIGTLGEEPKAEAALFEALDRLRQEIDSAHPLVLVGNVPTTNLIEQGGYIACKFRGLNACPETFPEQHGELEMLREKMNGYAEIHENVEFFDPYDTLCKNGRCKVADGAQSLYSRSCPSVASGRYPCCYRLGRSGPV